MSEFQRIKKLEKISNCISCMKNSEAKQIEILLLVTHFIQIILNIINFLIIPWKILNSSLKRLRIVILIFIVLSMLFLSFNQIQRKRRKLFTGYNYAIGFFGSIFSICLLILNFLFIFISSIIIVGKVKNYKEKRYEYKSILVIDIISLLIHIILFFLWFIDILRIYAKTNGSLKEFIQSKIDYFHKQQHMEIQIQNEKPPKQNDKQIDSIKFNNEDIVSHEQIIDKKLKGKDDDISSVETK